MGADRATPLGVFRRVISLPCSYDSQSRQRPQRGSVPNRPSRIPRPDVRWVVGKPQNEGIAPRPFASRILKAAFIRTDLIRVLSAVTLRRETARGAGTEAGTFGASGESLGADHAGRVFGASLFRCPSRRDHCRGKRPPRTSMILGSLCRHARHRATICRSGTAVVTYPMISW
jgi:hypothetical protein